MTRGIDSTAMEDEIREFGNIRGIFVIDLVASARGGPVRTIPYGGIEGHGLRGKLPTHGWGPHHLPNWNIINIEYDSLMAPQDGILMKILCGIKPKSVSLFPSNRCASVPIDVGLNSPFPPSYVPQELKVQFVMSLLKHISIRHIEGDDNPGRVIRGKLDGGAEESMEVEVLRSESSTSSLVEGDVDSSPITVKHKVGVAEELRVAFLEGEGGEVRQGGNFLAIGEDEERKGRTQE